MRRISLPALAAASFHIHAREVSVFYVIVNLGKKSFPLEERTHFAEEDKALSHYITHDSW